MRPFMWTWALFLTWWIILFDGASQEVTIIGRVYRGFSISPLGSIIGFFWALTDGLIGGAIFAWVYNFADSKLSK